MRFSIEPSQAGLSIKRPSSFNVCSDGGEKDSEGKSESANQNKLLKLERILHPKGEGESPVIFMIEAYRSLA